ncbi:MAG: Tll0287-like domain-containing protein [Nitrospiraceae bacterium]
MSRTSLWIIASMAFAFMAVISFWVIKLTIVDARKSDLVAPEKVTDYMHAIIEANRTVYTQNVVDQMHERGVVAVEHWKDEKSLPLPAQFLMDAGRLVSQKGYKFSYRLASLTPIYVWNAAQTDFERRGLEAVAKEPDKPFNGFVHIGNARHFQSIYADKALSQGCVTCHNNHPNSPRRDYKVNDVLGGVIITIPINE